MLDIAIVVIALIVIILGARGTYADTWNSLFPHYPISVPGNTASPTTGPARVEVTSTGTVVQAPVGNTGTTQPVVIGGSVNPIQSVVSSGNSGVRTIPVIVAPPRTPHFICDTNGQNCREVFG